MKAHKFSLILSLISMVIFLISAAICFIRINNRISEIKTNKPGIRVFTFDKPNVGMDIDAFDMMNISKEPIATSEAKLSAYYQSDNDAPCKFDIVMNNYSGYNKTIGVDGINSFEYTYEILKDGHLIMEEREIESFKEGSKTILLSDILESNDNNVTYTIIFRFYANEYDQNHLVGTHLNGDLSIIFKD